MSTVHLHKQCATCQRALAGACPGLGRRLVAVHSSTKDAVSVGSRRDLMAVVPALLSLGAAVQLVGSSAAYADDVVNQVAAAAEPTARATLAAVQKLAYLDVKIEGESIGRIVVELFDDVETGAQRFADLAEEKEGVGYRLSKFDGIFSTYIRNEGVKSLSYSATGASMIAGGDSVQALEDELAASSRRHDQAGLVSLVVKEGKERPIKERLVAMGGKLVTLKEQAGEAPNGTSFVITTGPTPDLDRTNLIVGRVVQGAAVVQAIAAQPYAKPRDSYYDKPFFEYGKFLGDKRTIVAEKRFNRPLKRVLVASAGVLQQ